MAGARDLGTQARQFAQVIERLLNRTVCDNAQVNAVTERRGAVETRIGTRLKRGDLSTEWVRLRSRARTKIWFQFSSTYFQNDEGHLTTKSSYCGIWIGDNHEDLLLHYDYEREKARYAEAHIQVAGRHPALERLLSELGRRGDVMKRLHLPVGGRRLRPAIEDVIEWLIAERLVEPKPGFEKVLDESRRDFRKIQIAALVRSNQTTAAEAMRAVGWEVA